MSHARNTDRPRPTPMEFGSYREFLRARFAYMKATQRRFSYRYFSAQTGYTSPNFLKLVIEGQRNLTLDSIQRFAKALALTRAEEEYFGDLVMFEQATNDADRNHHAARLRRQGGAVAALGDAQFEAYSLWYAMPLREMMLSDDFVEDPAALGKRLRPRVAAADVRSALDLLERTGLARRDAGGRLRPQDAQLATPPSVASLAVRNYHRAMLENAIAALDQLPQHMRNVTSVTVRLTPERYTEVCQRVSDFRAALMQGVVEEESRDPRATLHVVGIQVIPLTDREGES